jgi:hypothetical protein
MSSFADLADRLAQRDSMLRAAVWSAWAAVAGASALLALESIFTALRRPLPRVSLVIVGVTTAAACAAVFLARRRVRSPRGRLLLEVDLRLDLDARLSSLFEVEQRGDAHALADRLLRDLARIGPDWRKAIPVPSRLRILPAVAFLLVASTALLSVLAPHLVRTPADSSPSAATAHPAALEEAAATETSGESIAPNSAASSAATGEAGDVSGKSQRTLSEILSELRPALASAAASSSSGKSEDAAAALRLGLEQLRERLEQDDRPLSAAEVQTLHDATAASPSLETEVKRAIETSDVDALRETISQLLETPPTESGPPAQNPTGSDAAPTSASGASPVPASPSASPEGAPVDSSSTASSTATEGVEGAHYDPSVDEPLFESGVGSVATVAAPTTVGDTGSLSTYITQGVPVEQPVDAEGTPATWVLSPDRVQSVLSARDVPAGTADIIRDYFERITEENP